MIDIVARKKPRIGNPMYTLLINVEEHDDHVHWKLSESGRPMILVYSKTLEKSAQLANLGYSRVKQGEKEGCLYV